MSKLQLPDVTLVMIETREHELARMAIEDCLRVAEFGEVLVLTDNQAPFESPEEYQKAKLRGVDLFYSSEGSDVIEGQKVHFHQVPDWSSKEGWARSMWFDVPPLLRTSHMLGIQWDSWIWDASMWRDEFLQYDFIGAPWWYKDGMNVGNSGFCLKSTRLARYIAKHRGTFPCDTSAEDDLLCRKYRPTLEEAGFVWAPEKVAYDFAYEGCAGNKATRHFGFHALFNWPEVLDEERFAERIGVAVKSPYIRDGYMFRALCEKHPEIMKRMVQRKGAIHG